MKNILPLILLFIFTFTAFGQSVKTDKPAFDIADFNKKFETAQWLVAYDYVAWKTSDVVMTQDKKELERLGREWFAFQDKNNLWHAVYGKFENDKYDLVFHFTMDKTGKITRSDEKIDSELLNNYARALATAGKALIEAVGTKAPAFNQYIKLNADKTFSVWILPAFQTSGIAVYGGEFIYTIDASGKKITKDESYRQAEFRGFKADKPREIWLNYREKDKPTLGSIFFVWYYKQYFTNIYIDNAKTTSTVVKAGTDYIWVHTEKEAEK
jgi:hypothetical protein